MSGYQDLCLFDGPHCLICKRELKSGEYTRRDGYGDGGRGYESFTYYYCKDRQKCNTPIKNEQNNINKTRQM